MKIVVIGPVYPYRGGIAHYTTLLARALQGAGHDVQVISFKRQYPKWLYPGQSDRDPSREPLTIPAAYVLDPLYPWTWHAAVDTIVRYSPDIVLLQWWTTFWAPAFAFVARAVKAKQIRIGYLIHNVVPHEARPWDKFLAKWALQSGDAFLVQSSGQQDALIALIPDARVTLIKHPVYDMFSAQKMDKIAARQRLGLPEDMPLVLFFGIVRPYKGLPVLIDALGQLNMEDSSVGLLIAGEFWEDVQPYREQIARLSLMGKVYIDNRYIPNEELPTIFSAADIFAAPYTSATQSGAVKMALGFGLPVVITEPVLDETMHAGVDRGVFVCLPNDIPSLKNAITTALMFGNAGIPQEVNSAGWQLLIDYIQHLSPGDRTLRTNE